MSTTVRSKLGSPSIGSAISSLPTVLSCGVTASSMARLRRARSHTGSVLGFPPRSGGRRPHPSARLVGHEPARRTYDALVVDAGDARRRLGGGRPHDRRRPGQGRGGDAAGARASRATRSTCWACRPPSPWPGGAPVSPLRALTGRRSASRRRAATAAASASSAYLPRGQKNPRRPSLGLRGTTWVWRWGTLWLIRLLMATNDPAAPDARRSIARASRCARGEVRAEQLGRQVGAASRRARAAPAACGRGTAGGCRGRPAPRRRRARRGPAGDRRRSRRTGRAGRAWAARVRTAVG